MCVVPLDLRLHSANSLRNTASEERPAQSFDSHYIETEPHLHASVGSRNKFTMDSVPIAAVYLFGWRVCHEEQTAV